MLLVSWVLSWGFFHTPGNCPNVRPQSNYLCPWQFDHFTSQPFSRKNFFCLCVLLTHTAIKSAALALVAAKTLILQKKVFRFSFGQRHLLTRFSRGPGVMESYPSQILIKNLDSNGTKYTHVHTHILFYFKSWLNEMASDVI